MINLTNLQEFEVRFYGKGGESLPSEYGKISYIKDRCFYSPDTKMIGLTPVSAASGKSDNYFSHIQHEFIRTAIKLNSKKKLKFLSNMRQYIGNVLIQIGVFVKND